MAAEMDADDNYNYSQSLLFLMEFANPLANQPFIDEMEENYGKLWEFRDCVHNWTLGVSCFKKYVYLLHRESSPAGPFLPLNINEKVTLLKNFHGEYIVITVQVVDNSGEDNDHLHSIFVKVDSNGIVFNIDRLFHILAGMSMEVLRPKLQAKYVSWTYTSQEGAFRKINSIYQTTSQYASRTASAMPMLPVRTIPRYAAKDRALSQSRTKGSRSCANTAMPARQMRNIETLSEAEPSQKRRKSTPGARSSGFALTHVDFCAGEREEAIPDFEKFATVQDEFWKQCEACYIFGQQTYEVDIAQCVLVKEEYIIQKLQPKIVKSVKAELIQIGDEKMR